jgi:hypothetical protein
MPADFLSLSKARSAEPIRTNQQIYKWDFEGGVQPQSQNRVIVPLVRTLLAGCALDDDGSAAGYAVAFNGFGIVGPLPVLWQAHGTLRPM